MWYEYFVCKWVVNMLRMVLKCIWMPCDCVWLGSKLFDLAQELRGSKLDKGKEKVVE